MHGNFIHCKLKTTPLPSFYSKVKPLPITFHDDQNCSNIFMLLDLSCTVSLV